MREIRQSGSEGGGAPWRSLPLLALSRLRRFRMARGRNASALQNGPGTKRCSFRPRECAADAWGTVTKPVRTPRIAMPREPVAIAFFKRRRRERARAHGASRGYGRMRGPSPVGAIHPVALFRSAVDYGASRGLVAGMSRSPGGAKDRRTLSPLRGLTELRHNTRGLRLGLRCCRAGALLLWPLERQGGPRPRSGRCNSRGSRAASAASKRATRGSRNPDAPTAERSHWARSSSRTNLDLRPRERCLFAGTQRRLHRHRRALGRTMRPLRGRYDAAGGSAGRAPARFTRRARPTAITSTAVGTTRRAVPRVARLLVAFAALDPRIPESRCVDRGAVALGSQFEPYESRSSAKGEMPLCRDTTSIASPPARIGTDDATAPRSVRRGYSIDRGRGPVCLSDGQTRGISSLTGNNVAPALSTACMF